ncbi:hypothetical protein ABEB36_009994 [Hypothenemus hampei]|uniref:rRNA methyltransferase 2, mitochondrial n=1 Tax=Hypothenemus hampei TaxID=57062 RepID=A0ABD1EI58_HYPHA
MKKTLITRFFHIRMLSGSCCRYKKVQPSVKSKNVSSHDWLTRQLSDPFVEMAKKYNYRCRSAFKLIEIDDKFKILLPGNVVIDCGAAPGSWTQVAVKRVNANLSDKNGSQGTVIAIDKQLIYPIEGASIFENMDFTEQTSQEKLVNFLGSNRADAVLSDMAPSATGIRDLDRENIIKLCYSALKFAVIVSKKGASVLVKLWQGQEMLDLQRDMSRFYDNVKIVKPNSSRSDSIEMFMLGRGFKGLR